MDNNIVKYKTSRGCDVLFEKIPSNRFSLFFSIHYESSGVAGDYRFSFDNLEDLLEQCQGNSFYGITNGYDGDICIMDSKTSEYIQVSTNSCDSPEDLNVTPTEIWNLIAKHNG